MSKSSESETSSSSGATATVVPPEKGTTWLQLLFRILLVLLCLFLILAVIGYYLPRDYSVSSSRVIDAGPEEIFPLLVNLDRWKEWSPGWDFEKNSQIASFHFLENRKGVTWRHVDRGVTSIWISEFKVDEELTMRLEDAAFPGLKMVTRIELSPTADNQTKVTWSSETRLPRESLVSGVFYGWGGLMYTGGLETQYERDLTRLKTACEADESKE